MSVNQKIEPLELFLNAKPLYYDVIDYDRMPRIYAAIKQHFSLPEIIHIVGTNAKGSSGRYLAIALQRLGFDTGHYTSPHIVRFNERIWRNGHDASDEALETAHKWLLELLDPSDAKTLSYFEYTTLLAMRVFQGCEYVVLEAGLGGEHDATNVFSKRLSLFTPIDFDHQDFLGDTIEAIAFTKMRSMADIALCARQPHPKSYEVFNALAIQRNVSAYTLESVIDDAQRDAVKALIERHHLAGYMADNIQNAWGVLELLGHKADIALFDAVPLFGRMTPLRHNIFLDVGHNPLAARAIADHFKGRKIRLIYNSYADKDYKTILEILKPVIERVELIPIANQRAEAPEALIRCLEELDIAHVGYDGYGDKNTYLVFGSFSVAEAFLACHTDGF